MLKTCRPSAAANGHLRLRSGSASRTGGQGDPWLRRLRHADRPPASKGELAEFSAELADPPGQFHCPTHIGALHLSNFRRQGIAPRHVDLRPFVLQGAQDVCSFPAASRASRSDGSLVVNSSQGGGTKDTWVLEDTICHAPPTTSSGSHVMSSARISSRVIAAAIAATRVARRRPTAVPMNGSRIVRRLGDGFFNIPRNRPLDEANVIEFLAFAPDNPGSIRNPASNSRAPTRAPFARP